MRYTFLFAILLTAFSAFSQTAVTDSFTRIFYIGAGYQYQSFGNLSSRIALYPEFQKPGKHYVGAYFGFSNAHEQLLFDYSLQLGNSTSGDQEKRSTSLFNVGGGIDLGVDLSSKKTFRIYPMLGVSIETYRAKLNRDVSGVSFDSILVSNPVQQRTEPVVFSNTLFCFRAGVGIDFLHFHHRFVENIGFRFSYTGSFKKESWRVNETQLLSGAPADRVSQFKAALITGFGKRFGSRMR